MHIILGALGSVATILWILYRLAGMGINLGGLNPFLWRRRRRWKQKYQANPIFSIEKPMEAAALVLTAAAKMDGDMTSEEKKELLEIFEKEFHLSKRDAASLLVSSTFLIGRGDEMRESLGKVLAPSAPNFTPQQAESVLLLAGRVSEVGGPPSEAQRDFLEMLSRNFEASFEPNGKWA